MKKVFLDMDGVLTDYVKSACIAHNQRDPYVGDNPATSDDLKTLFGMSKADYKKPIDCFEFWAGLCHMPDGLNILAALEQQFGKRNICILSSPSMDPDAIGGRLWWIDMYLPQYKKQLFLGEPKHAIAGPDKILIDDMDANCENWVAAGGEAILVPRQWNKNRIYDTMSFLMREIM
jgi:5'(3')-deoxyribonucleotidase